LKGKDCYLKGTGRLSNRGPKGLRKGGGDACIARSSGRMVKAEMEDLQDTVEGYQGPNESSLSGVSHQDERGKGR